MVNNIAFIFPAFITDYTKKEIDFLEMNQVDFNSYILMASKAIGKELPPFSYDSDVYKNDELLSQIIAYLFSCAINDVLRKKEIRPELLAGYSMGIYAALYATNSILIEDGVRLINKAFQLVRELSGVEEYGMGAIIGLETDDVEKLIVDNQLETEIINVNNQHSLVIAGKKGDVIRLIDFAKVEGALSVMELTVNTPYHSRYLLPLSNAFKSMVDSFQMKDAEFPIVSTYNQNLLKNEADLRSELVFNLTEKINWFKTMQKLIDFNTDTFYECGAGKDLTKIARFIDGDYAIQSIYKI